jgi:hypothetical protein
MLLLAAGIDFDDSKPRVTHSKFRVGDFTLELQQA